MYYTVTLLDSIYFTTVGKYMHLKHTNFRNSLLKLDLHFEMMRYDRTPNTFDTQILEGIKVPCNE